nr:galactose-binding lectin and cartilage oligomeric matrix domain-containing protein [Crepidula fornicata]
MLDLSGLVCRRRSLTSKTRFDLSVLTMKRSSGNPWPLVVRRWLLVLALLVGAVGRAEGYHTYACEGGMIHLECQPGSKLLIHNAFFGKKQGTLNRCGETVRATQPCEHDITKFMKHSCDGKLFCQEPVELSSFNLDTFCPDYMKYAEVRYDCVLPATVQRVQDCVSRCLPPPRPAPLTHVGLHGPKAHQNVPGSAGNSVVSSSSAQPAASNPPSPTSPKASGTGLSNNPNANHFSAIASTINNMKARMKAARPSGRARAANPLARARMLAGLMYMMRATRRGQHG